MKKWRKPTSILGYPQVKQYSHHRYPSWRREREGKGQEAYLIKWWLKIYQSWKCNELQIQAVHETPNSISPKKKTQGYIILLFSKGTNKQANKQKPIKSQKNFEGIKRKITFLSYMSSPPLPTNKVMIGFLRKNYAGQKRVRLCIQNNSWEKKPLQTKNIIPSKITF